MPKRKAILTKAALAVLVLIAESAPVEGGDAEGASKAPPDSIQYHMPEIVVSAKRLRFADELPYRSGFVALVDVRSRRDRLEDLSAALEQVVGVRVKRYGGLGSFATASIRGSSASQVSVYLDGVPIADPVSGVANLGDIPLGGIDRIEIFRGFSPSHFGSSAIGGAINLVSEGPAGRDSVGPRPEIEGYASTGSFGTRRCSASLSANCGPVRMHAHGGRIASDGDFAFLDDNATPENPDDDTETVRRNNDHDIWNFIGGIDADFPGFESVALRHHLIERDGGVPGVRASQSTAARLETKRHITCLKIGPRLPAAGRISIEGNGFYTWNRESFFDPGGDINLTKQDTNNRIIAHGGNARARAALPLLPLSLDLFYEGRAERFHPVNMVPRPQSGPDNLRRSQTLSISADLSAFRDRAIFTAGTRHEWLENEMYDPPFMPWLPPTPRGKIRSDMQTPNFGIRLSPLHYFTIKGNWGRYYREPTFLELFGNTGSVTGSADLVPEKGINRDIGFIVTAERAWVFESPYLEAVYLDNEVENLILFFPNSQYTLKPKNIGAARIRGLELTAAFTAARWIRVSGNFTGLDARDASDIPYYNGNELPTNPGREGTVRVTFTRRWWSASYDMHHMGSNYLDRANQKEVPGREIHNLSLTGKLPDHGVSLTVEGINLGDRRFEDVSGYPLPGRSFYATLKACI